MGNFTQNTVQMPLSPADISIVQRAFSRSIASAGLSQDDPQVNRLAALAIHLYQTGLHDEDLLRRTLIGARDDHDA